MLGQDEYLDWTDYSDLDWSDYASGDTLDWSYYQEGGGASWLPVTGSTIGEMTAESGGILNIVKSILGIATPVVTSMLTASQQQATQQSALQRALTTSSGIPTSTLGASLSGLTSNLPLLAGIL